MSFKSPKMDNIQGVFQQFLRLCLFPPAPPPSKQDWSHSSDVSATGLKEIEGHNVDVWSPIFSCLQRPWMWGKECWMPATAVVIRGIPPTPKTQFTNHITAQEVHIPTTLISSFWASSPDRNRGFRRSIDFLVFNDQPMMRIQTSVSNDRWISPKRFPSTLIRLSLGPARDTSFKKLQASHDHR